MKVDVAAGARGEEHRRTTRRSTRSSSRSASHGRPPKRGSRGGAVVVAVAAVVLAVLASSKLHARSGAPRRFCSAATARRTWSTSPFRSRVAIDDLHRAVDEVAAALARVDRRVDDALVAHGADPLRRLRGHGRPPVGLHRAARLGPLGDRADRDPGPRLRAGLREAARPRPHVDRALARGAAGRRTRHGRGHKTAAL